MHPQTASTGSRRLAWAGITSGIVDAWPAAPKTTRVSRLPFGNRPAPVELDTPRGYLVSMNGYTDNKADLRKRLSRVEGQVRGISRMVDEDKYCIDILTQVAAATKALETVALSLLSDHLSHCVAQASAEGGEVAAEKVREANDAIARLVRS